MTLCIVMTKEQADAVRGDTAPYARLRPRNLGDGRYTLPADVLNDPAHESKWALLASYPTKEIEDPPTK